MKRIAPSFRAVVLSLLCVLPSGSWAGDRCSVTRSHQTVRGTSMSELFQPGDRIDSESGYYSCHPPLRKDVVLVTLPGFKAPLLKRLLVLPGDRFTLAAVPAGYRLEVNGKPLKTPKGREYVFRDDALKMIRLYEKQFAGVMPADRYFVFGTQPGGSRDSTRFGPVPRAALTARVLRKVRAKSGSWAGETEESD